MAWVVNVDRILGLLAGSLGNLPDAAMHFQNANAFCRMAGYRPELAWTCHDHAASLMQLGGPEDQEKLGSLLEEGLSIATELGMTPLVIKATGLQDQIDSTREMGSAYPDGLTKREIEVLILLAAGKSNQIIAEELFISHNTVIRHVSNIYAKAKVANRAQATAYALRNGLA